MYGNNVSFAENKTRRTWNVNSFKKTFYSDALEEDIKVRVSSKALRTIKKHGSFDNYIMRSKWVRMTPFGEDLYQKIKAAQDSKGN